MSATHPERALAAAAHALVWETVPPETKAAIRRLFLDWVGSAFAGAASDPARMLERVVGGGGDSGRAPATAAVTGRQERPPS